MVRVFHGRLRFNKYTRHWAYLRLANFYARIYSTHEIVLVVKDNAQFTKTVALFL